MPFDYGYALPEDEDEFQDGFDLEPDKSLSDRPQLEDTSIYGRIQKNNPQLSPEMPNVRDRIAERVGLLKKYAGEPEMDAYEDETTELEKARASRRAAGDAANIAAIANRMSMGANTPKGNDTLVKNLEKQGEDELKSKENELERRQKVAAAIEARKAREASAAEMKQYRDENLDLRRQSLQSRNERLSSMNISRANSLFNNPGINREITRLNASSNVSKLVHGIRTGEIKDSKNIRNQLTNMIATIDLGTPGGQGDRENMGINNLYSKLQDAKSWIESNPQSTISPAYLDQLEAEAQALGDRAAMNYSAMTRAAISGADLSGGNPEVDPGQVHQLANQRRSTYLKSIGYDDEGNPLNRRQHSRPPGGGNAPLGVSQPPLTDAGASMGISEAFAGDGQKRIKSKQYSPSRQQTRIFYDDGSTELVDGRR
jgi:hypothetical protein